MLDVDKCKEILEHHFATVTREEFLANLEEFCPEFIAAGIEYSAADPSQATALYQQVKQESKLEIAPNF